MARQYTTQDFIDAIPGTGGIITAIARKVGCSWNTASKFIKDHATVAQAYADERESVLDMSESVVFGNIRLAARDVAEGRLADTGDAKWLLSRLGKERGYHDKLELGLPAEEIDAAIERELARLAATGKGKNAPTVAGDESADGE